MDPFFIIGRLRPHGTLPVQQRGTREGAGAPRGHRLRGLGGVLVGAVANHDGQLGRLDDVAREVQEGGRGCVCRCLD